MSAYLESCLVWCDAFLELGQHKPTGCLDLGRLRLSEVLVMSCLHAPDEASAGPFERAGSHQYS